MKIRFIIKVKTRMIPVVVYSKQEFIKVINDYRAKYGECFNIIRRSIRVEYL